MASACVMTGDQCLETCADCNLIPMFRSSKYCVELQFARFMLNPVDNSIHDEFRAWKWHMSRSIPT